MSYQKLFQLDLKHEYFSGSSGFEITFTPCKATQFLFDRYNFIFRQIGASLFVFSNQKNASEYLNYIQTKSESKSFDFNIESKDEDFYAFTDIPSDFVGCFQYSSDGTESSLSLLNQQIGDFNYFAQVSIGFDSLIKLDAQFMLNLKARKSIWQYFIINQSKTALEALQVKGKEGVSFSAGEKMHIENGAEAILFQSEGEPIPFLRSSKYVFNLVNLQKRTSQIAKDSIKEQIVIKGLPIPEPSKMKIITNQGKVITSSPMYVYV